MRGLVLNMATLEGSLEDEALKRRERLKALRKKSGLPDEQVFKGLKLLSICLQPFTLFSFFCIRDQFSQIHWVYLGVRTCDFMFVCLIGSCRGLVII